MKFHGEAVWGMEMLLDLKDCDPTLMTRAKTQESMVNVKRGELLGVLYLDSKRPAAFSKLDRQILDALAADAASILDNARLVERERERQRLEQEINIARDQLGGATKHWCSQERKEIAGIVPWLLRSKSNFHPVRM